VFRRVAAALLVSAVALLSIQGSAVAVDSWKYKIEWTVQNSEAGKTNTVVLLPINVKQLVELKYIESSLTDLRIESGGQLMSHTARLVDGSLEVLIPQIDQYQSLTLTGYLGATPERAEPWGFSGEAVVTTPTGLTPETSSLQVSTTMTVPPRYVERTAETTLVPNQRPEPPAQRVIVTEDGTAFLFFRTGSGIEYSALLGKSWTDPVLISGTTSTDMFGVFYKDGKVVIVRNRGGITECYISVGTVSQTSITWGSWINAGGIMNNDGYDPTVTVDSSNRIVIGYSYYDGIDYHIRVSRGSDAWGWGTATTWTLYTGAYEEPNLVLALSSDKLYAIRQQVNTVKGHIFDGSSWSAAEYVSTRAANACRFSALSIGDDVYVTMGSYLLEGGLYDYWVDFRVRSGGSWQGAVELHQTLDDATLVLPRPAISTDGEKVAVMYNIRSAVQNVYKRVASVADTTAWTAEEKIWSGVHAEAQGAPSNALFFGLQDSDTNVIYSEEIKRALAGWAEVYGIRAFGDRVYGYLKTDVSEYLLSATSTPGLKALAISYDGSTFKLTVDGSEVASTAASGSVGAPTSFTITEGALWSSKVEVLIGGVSKAKFFGVIDAGSISDLSGTGNTGSEVKRYTTANPSGITVSASAITSYYQPPVFAPEVEPKVTVAEPTAPSEWVKEKTLSHIPMAGFVSWVAEALEIPERVLWAVGTICVVAALAVMCFTMTQNFIMSSFVAGTALVFASVIGSIPLWVVLPFAVITLSVYLLIRGRL